RSEEGDASKRDELAHDGELPGAPQKGGDRERRHCDGDGTPAQEGGGERYIEAQEERSGEAVTTLHGPERYERSRDPRAQHRVDPPCARLAREARRGEKNQCRRQG